MELLDSVRAKMAEKRREANAEYWRVLVGSLDTPADAKAGSRLANLVRELGKSSADLDEDARRVRRVASLRATVEAGRDSATRAAEARRDVEAYDRETKRIIEERRAGYATLYAEQRRHEKAQVDSNVARGELERLSASEPELCLALADDGSR